MYSVHGVVQKVLPVLLCMLMPLADAQYRGRRPAAGTSTPLPLKGLTVTFHGVVKKITKKELMIESDENNQLLTLRCSGKTKFHNDDGVLKWSDIDLESRVSVEASEDNDLKLMALNVKLEAAPKKALGK